MVERADLERDVIALLVRGFMSLDDARAIPVEAFTGAPRLLAWTCAVYARCGWRPAPSSPGALDASELIARCPPELRAFVTERIARPIFATPADAKAEILAALHRRRRPAVEAPFHAVRLVLATFPRLALPLDVWAELQRDAHAELDAAEKVDTFDPSAPRRLLQIIETAADEGPHDTKGNET